MGWGQGWKIWLLWGFTEKSKFLGGGINEKLIYMRELGQGIPPGLDSL